MNAVSRFDAKRREFKTAPVWAPAALSGAGALIAILLLFQLFFRYQYFENHGALWRLDRLTQKICRYSVTSDRCIVPKFSTSTSTSTSLSTSLTVKPARKKS